MMYAMGNHGGALRAWVFWVLIAWGMTFLAAGLGAAATKDEERTLAFYRQMFNEIAHSGTLNKIPPAHRWPKHDQLAAYLTLEIFYHPAHNTTILELEQFVKRWPRFPQMKRIQRFLDKRIVRDGSFRKVLSRLDKRKPPNVRGRVRYLQALLSVKRMEKAKKVWTGLYRIGAYLPKHLDKRLEFFFSQATADDHAARARSFLELEDRKPFEEVLSWLPESRQNYLRALQAAHFAETRLHQLLPKLTDKQRTTGELWFMRINGLRKNGFSIEADKLIWGPEGRHLSAKQRRKARFRLGRIFLYLKGDFKRAYRLFNANVKEMGAKLEDSMWMAGWSLYMDGQKSKAAKLFERLAKEGMTEDRRSQAAYWVYRIYANQKKKKKESRKWREMAAAYPGTFYGLLARDGMVKDKPGIPPLEEPQVKCAFPKKNKAFDRDIKRLKDLQMVGRSYYNGPEIEAIAKKYKLGNKEQLCLARTYGDPKHSITVASRMRTSGGPALWSYLYPVPNWRPWVGWKLDQALVWGMARQESLLFHRAQSWVGAKGLLQLMPATAKKEAQVLNMPPSTRFRLSVPGYNLSLGQSYMSRMTEQLSGNHILGFIAYNAGPHRAARWRKSWNRHGDVLTFMENIPITETRKYVRKVLTGVMMYELQFNKRGFLRRFLKFRKMPLHPIEG